MRSIKKQYKATTQSKKKGRKKNINYTTTEKGFSFFIRKEISRNLQHRFFFFDYYFSLKDLII